MRNEDPERGTRLWDVAQDTLRPAKWCNNPGERGPAMCAHGGTSDPFSRCIIRNKCIGKDVTCYRKPRDVLISQSNVCSSLVRPIKGHVWGNKARVA